MRKTGLNKFGIALVVAGLFVAALSGLLVLGGDVAIGGPTVVETSPLSVYGLMLGGILLLSGVAVVLATTEFG